MSTVDLQQVLSLGTNTPNLGLIPVNGDFCDTHGNKYPYPGQTYLATERPTQHIIYTTLRSAFMSRHLSVRLFLLCRYVAYNEYPGQATYKSVTVLDTVDPVNLIRQMPPGSNLSRYNVMGHELFGVDLRGSNLTELYAIRTAFRFASLEGADMSGADLRMADLRGTRLTNTILDGARMYSANLYGADMSKIIGTPNFEE